MGFDSLIGQWGVAVLATQVVRDRQRMLRSRGRSACAGSGSTLLAKHRRVPDATGARHGRPLGAPVLLPRAAGSFVGRTFESIPECVSHLLSGPYPPDVANVIHYVDRPSILEPLPPRQLHGAFGEDPSGRAANGVASQSPGATARHAGPHGYWPVLRHRAGD